jgi:hypothetical protein
MKALSLWQPWATLIAIGAKCYETRSWAVGYRGPIAIHAAKRQDYDSLALCLEEPFRQELIAGGIRYPKQLPFGAIVAVATLHDCHLCKGVWVPNPAGAPHELAFGDFSPGRYAWVLHAVRPLKSPVPCRGFQGLWDVPPEIEETIRRLVKL